MASSSTKFSSRVVADAALQRNVSTLRSIVPSLARDAVNEHALNVQARAKEILTEGNFRSSTRDGFSTTTRVSGPAVDTGRLRASIKIEMFQNGFAARVGSDLQYAPYIEFGTGPRSKMPPLEPIRQWCRRHSIPESAAYPIALAIMRRGTPAKPFLFPAYEIERPNLEAVIISSLLQLSRFIV